MAKRRNLIPTAGSKLAALMLLAVAGCVAPGEPQPQARIELEAEPVGQEPIYWTIDGDEVVAVHAQPSAASPVVDEIPAGTATRVRNLGCAPVAPSAPVAWCRIETDTRVGWVPGDALEG